MEVKGLGNFITWSMARLSNVIMPPLNRQVIYKMDLSFCVSYKDATSANRELHQPYESYPSYKTWLQKWQAWKYLAVTQSCSIASSLTKPFNISIQSGSVPYGWKSSVIVPIPKDSEKSMPEVKRFWTLFCCLTAWLSKRLLIVGLYRILAFNPAYHLEKNPTGLRFKMHGQVTAVTTVSVQVALQVDWRDTHWIVSNLTVHVHKIVHHCTLG